MHSAHRQKGITLVVTLLFLVIISMYAVSSYNSSTTNMRAAGNMIVRQEALSAAQETIERTISNKLFTTDPTAVAGVAYQVDVDGDSVADYSAMLTPKPSCHRTRVIKLTELDPAKSADIACMVSAVSGTSGIEVEGAPIGAGDSMCATTEWNVRAAVTDMRTSTRVAVNQGIGIRVLSTDAADFCI